MNHPKRRGRPTIAWTPDMDAVICDYRSKGIAWDAIARRVGVSSTATKARAVVLRAAGRITGPERTHSPRIRRTQEHTRKLVEAWQAGTSIYQASRDLGVEYAVAKYWARQIGLTEARQ